MATDRFTYRQLDELLLSLGFSRQHVAPKWRRYDHRASDTTIALVEKGPKEPVRITDAVSIRLLLVEKGLLTEAELDKALSRSASAQEIASGKKA